MNSEEIADIAETVIQETADIAPPADYRRRSMLIKAIETRITRIQGMRVLAERLLADDPDACRRVQNAAMNVGRIMRHIPGVTDRKPQGNMHGGWHPISQTSRKRLISRSPASKRRKPKQ